MDDKKYIILDAMGVIFEEKDDFREVFMPSLKEKTRIYGECNKVQIIESAYLNLTLSNISSQQFFKQLGITNPSLDFLLNLTLNPEFSDFSARIKNRKEFNLAVLSNDSQEWANYRNYKLGLNKIIPFYITSSLFGVRKPDRKVYEKLCWLLRTSPENCIYIDNLDSNLQEPKNLGMRVIRFGDGDNERYMGVQDFNELYNLLTENEYVRV